MNLTPEQLATIAARHQNALKFGTRWMSTDDVGALLVELRLVTRQRDDARSAAAWRGAVAGTGRWGWQ